MKKSQKQHDASEQQMRIGPVEVTTVDDRLNILEGAFQSRMWKNLNNEDRLRIVGRLEHILELSQLIPILTTTDARLPIRAEQWT